MAQSSKQTADIPVSRGTGRMDPSKLVDIAHDGRTDLPIDDRVGERDMTPTELMNANEDARKLIDVEAYDTEQAYQIALTSAKDNQKTLSNPKPLNFDGQS
jgi:hypothetical protein